METAVARTGEYIDLHLEIARSLGKPLVIEEFGYPRDDYRYDEASTTTGRDAYYAYVFGRVAESKAAGDRLLGVNFWGWGGFAAHPEGHTDWQKGDDYSGDPAQEAQGLNSVYVHDTSTLSVIAGAVEKLQ